MSKSTLGRAAALLGAAAAGTWLTRQALRRRHRISFYDRTVVLTGGSRGLGLEMARAFAAEGANVALLARNADELERARQDVLRHADPPAHVDGRVMAIPCDVTDDAEVQQAIQQVVERHGGVDALVNNAGIIQVGPVEHMLVDDFDQALAVHLRGALHTMRAVIPHMRRQGGGRIVNVASVGGRIAVPHMAPYAASKFALVGLSDAMRAELGRYGIRVTTVCPGLMRTGSHVHARFKGDHDAEYSWFAASAGMPLVSMDARRAAWRILEACRYGDRHLTLGWAARLAEVVEGLLPGAVGGLVALADRALPGPSTEGDVVREGEALHAAGPARWIERRLAPAAARNNESAAPS